MRYDFFDWDRWQNEVKNGSPKAVEYMAKYLIERGYKIVIYKHLFKSDYSLTYRNTTAYKLSAFEVMEILKSPFMKEKQKEVEDYFRRKIQRELLEDSTK